MSLQDVGVKFRAMSLHLEAACPEDREARASEHTATLECMLSGCTMKARDKKELESMVTSASRDLWSAGNLSRLLRALEGTSSSRRRESQRFGDGRILGYFTESEWSRWKSEGLQGKDNTAAELVHKVKKLGGKNLDEYSKKYLVAVWLFLRGDGRTLGIGARSLAAEQFKNRLARAVRDFEPPIYPPELPPKPCKYKEQYPDLYTAAFPDGPPTPLSEQDIAGVEYLDGLLKCRGTGSGGDVGEHCHQISLQPSQSASLMQVAMQQFGAMMLQSQMQMRQTGVPGFQLFMPQSQAQPTGRPMRSLGQVNGDPGQLSLPPIEQPGPPPVESDAAAGETKRPSSSSAADDVEKVSSAMLSRKRKGESPSPKKKTKRTVVDEESSESSEESVAPMKSKKTPLTPTTKTPMKAKKGTAKDTTATPSKTEQKKGPKSPTWPNKPRIGWERSRRQVMCRSGKTGPGTTMAITFDDAGGAKKAWKKAEVWLEKTMKEYTSRKTSR